MNVTQRLKEIGREDYQGFLAEISDKWAYQMQQVNGTLSAMLFDCTIADLQSEFERYQPILKNGLAVFQCERRIGGEEWESTEISIPAKIWWRFLFNQKTTFVTWRMIN